MNRNRYLITLSMALLLCTGVSQAKEEITSKQKKKLSTLLQGIEKKAKETKPRKHEIAVPVATAGVRGAEAVKSSQFAVVWPGLDISPLSALAENLKHDSANAGTARELREQVEEFLKTFPEFSDEPLLKEALEVLQ